MQTIVIYLTDKRLKNITKTNLSFIWSTFTMRIIVNRVDEKFLATALQVRSMFTPPPGIVHANKAATPLDLPRDR